MQKYILLTIFLTVSSAVTFAQSAPKPYGVLPTARQLKWQETEMYAIIHFSTATYTDKEWGYGDENPAIFNPSNFSAYQILSAAKAGGIKGAVIVAKHHDGFCLWPTKTTEHNISKSPFRNGKGDVIKEYQLASEKLGMKMGIYCSPWDRNSAAYGTDEYAAKIYRNQLRELYTNYGELFMSWHDGANGGDGYYGGSREVRKIDKTTYYGWKDTWALTRALQPAASIFGDAGPDVRWVGNEEGHAGETSWHTFSPQAVEGNIPSNGNVKYWESVAGTRNGNYWIPAECDVPLRPGWFYHQAQDGSSKSARELVDLYYKSVGRGACLDLGLAPDKSGQLTLEDVNKLKEFGEIIRKTFAINLAKHASIVASNVRDKNAIKYGTAKLTDGDRYSYWATDDKMTRPILNVNMAKAQAFNVIRLRENIKLGQRIDSVKIEALANGKWKLIAKATSIGACRLIKLPESITASKIRIYLYAPVAIALSDIGLFKEPLLTVAKTNIPAAALQQSLPKSGWKIINKSAPHASYAIDDDENTIFEDVGDEDLPQQIIVDMGTVQKINAFTYLPRQDKKSEGMVDKYIFWTSEDGVTWRKAVEGELANIRSNPIIQTIALGEPIRARYFKFSALRLVNGTNFSVAELGVL